MSPRFSTSKLTRKPLIKKPHGEAHASGSPKWSNTVKLLVGVSLFIIAAWLFLRFQSIVGLLLFAVVLAYLLYPLAKWFHAWSHFTWRWSVSVVFLVVIIIILGLTTLSGLAVIEQSQSLIGFLERSLRNLPDFLQSISSQPIAIGPYEFTPNFTDLNAVSQDLLGMVQPILGRAGSILGTILSGAANFFGLFFFILLIAYFILTESGGGSNQLIHMDIPGYNEDFEKFGVYLSGIWNAFLRGQLTIILITILVYMVLLGALGLRFFIGLALLAGLARFVPYVGPAVAWTSYGLVAYFQGYTIFGLAPIWYVVLVVGLAWVTDIILDNFVGTRLMGNALQIHPAAVMVSALVGANLFGIVGIVLAAPVVATLKLVMGYIFNRLFDQDPWQGIKTAPVIIQRPYTHRIRVMLMRIRTQIRNFFREKGIFPKIIRQNTKE
jgi:predicted PurR-regulated permease PerM